MFDALLFRQRLYEGNYPDSECNESFPVIFDSSLCYFEFDILFFFIPLYHKKLNPLLEFTTYVFLTRAFFPRHDTICPR